MEPNKKVKYLTKNNMELDDNAKKQILQRILAQKNRVETYDVQIVSFSEYKNGIEVSFLLDGVQQGQELITWWEIAMKA